jgi:hypothetical protein
MSHIIKIDAKLKNQRVLVVTCQRLGLDYEVNSSAEFYSGTAQGMVIQLNGWKYPIVVGSDGTVSYDNYGGSWGDEVELKQLIKTYAGVISEEVIASLGMVVDSNYTNDKNQVVIHAVRR